MHAYMHPCIGCIHAPTRATVCSQGRLSEHFWRMDSQPRNKRKITPMTDEGLLRCGQVTTSHIPVHNPIHNPFWSPAQNAARRDSKDRGIDMSAYVNISGYVSSYVDISGYVSTYVYICGASRGALPLSPAWSWSPRCPL